MLFRSTVLCRRALEDRSADSSRALHQIAITVCDQCGRGWQDGAGVVAELGEPAVEQAFCDTEHIGSLDGEKPARASQDIPPATRRFLLRRDHGRCQVPGCRSARNIDIHHIVLRTEGGSNAASNLILCCSAHHRALHRGLLAITVTAPDALVFTRLEQEAAAPANASVVKVACDALARMGFRMTDARRLVTEARAHVGTASLKELIHEALRRSPVPH